MKHQSTKNIRVVHSLPRQRGASLLEGIAYLGIAAIVVLGAVSLLTGAFSSAQSNQAIEEAIALRTATRKMYSGQAFPAAITQTLITAKAIPGTLVVNGANVTNKWGGAVTVAGNGAGSAFNVSFANVPQDVCVSMLSGANGWTQIAQGGTTITSANMPVTAAAATNLCNAAVNTVVFTAT